MKNRSVVAFFLTSVLSVQTAFADESECFEVAGEIQIFPSNEGTCPLVMENGDRFEQFEVNFLFNDYNNTTGFPTCFSGQLENTVITIDGMAYDAEGSSESALTNNFLIGEVPNAASAIKISSPKFVKGGIFTLDSIGLNGEFLKVVSGNRVYKEVVVVDPPVSYITIDGNALLNKVPFGGQICLE